MAHKSCLVLLLEITLQDLIPIKRKKSSAANREYGMISIIKFQSNLKNENRILPKVTQEESACLAYTPTLKMEAVRLS
jgi:hypothetical protein